MITRTTRAPARPQPVLKRDLDDDIRRDALAVLHASGFSSLRNLGCQVENGVVELTGAVRSFYLKQMAQAVVMRLNGINGVRNHVRVDCN